MGRTPPAPRARRRRIEQSPRRQSPSTRVALNATGTNVEIHATPTKREPEDGPKSSFHLRPLSEAPCRLGVTSGKTPSEYRFSELPQVADILRSPFGHLANPLVLQITAFGARAIPGPPGTQGCHEIIQNRLALVGEESVSVGHWRQPLSGQSGAPTHAHLHHRQ